MNRIFWWLADAVSETLEPAERDAVRGDLAEAGESGAQTLCDLLGLVARRQALWSRWDPWVRLLGLIVPLGLLLSILSSTVVGEGAVYTWLYVNNWDSALLKNPGFWPVLGESARLAFLGYLKLSCWSWTAGFVLGWASRPIKLRLNSILLCLVLLFGVCLGSPLYFEYFSRMFAPLNTAKANDPLGKLMFYRVMFPAIVEAIFVAVPALWGLQEGSVARGMRRTFRSVLWTAVIATLLVMLIEAHGLVFWVVTAIYRRPLLWHSWGPLEHLELVAYWPVFYLMVRVVARGLRSKPERAGMALYPF